MEKVKGPVRSHVVVSLLIWGALFVFFYTLGSGITCTNDGSHFALIKSLVENNSAVLGENAAIAKHDVSTYKGQYFADRNPGLAFVAYIFVKILSPVKSYFVPIIMDPYYRPQGRDVQILLAMVMLIPPLCGSLLFVVMSKTFRRFGLTYFSATAFSLILITSSLTLRYSTVLYSHILAVLLISSSYLVLLDFYENRKLRFLFFGNLLLSVAVIVEHPTLVVYIPMILFLVLKTRKTLLSLKGISLFLVSAAIPVVPFLIYNYVNFDHPLSLAHFHHKTFDYFRDPMDIFRFRHFPLMFKQVFWYHRKFTSLLTSSPYYFLAFLSVIPFVKKEITWDSRYSVALAALIASIIPATTFSGDSGYDFDYRQMLFGLPFMMIFFITFAKYVISKWDGTETVRGIMAGLIFMALAGKGWVTHFSHIRHEGQDPAPTMFINPEAAFRNTLPVIILGLVITAWMIFRFRANTAKP